MDYFSPQMSLNEVNSISMLGLASDDDLTLAAEMSDSAQDAYQDYDEEN